MARLGGEFDPGGIGQFEARAFFLAELERLCLEVVREAGIMPAAEWARKHNLDAPWIIEAVEGIKKSAKDGEMSGLAISAEAYWDMPPEEASLSWNPAEETREAFEKRMKDYLDRREAAAWQQGWQPTPAKRVMNHFAWMVHYQVQGWSMRQIADRYSGEGRILTEDTISKGIRQAAKLVGLRLRPGSRGPKPEIKR